MAPFDQLLGGGGASLWISRKARNNVLGSRPASVARSYHATTFWGSSRTTPSAMRTARARSFSSCARRARTRLTSESGLSVPADPSSDAAWVNSVAVGARDCVMIADASRRSWAWRTPSANHAHTTSATNVIDNLAIGTFV